MGDLDISVTFNAICYFCPVVFDHSNLAGWLKINFYVG